MNINTYLNEQDELRLHKKAINCLFVLWMIITIIYIIYQIFVLEIN